MMQDSYDLEYQKQLIINYSQQNDLFVLPEHQQQQQQLQQQQFNNCWIDDSIPFQMTLPLSEASIRRQLYEMVNTSNTVSPPSLNNNLSQENDQSSSSPPLNNNLQYGDQMVSQPLSNNYSPYSNQSSTSPPMISDQSSSSPPLNNNLQYGDQMVLKPLSNNFSPYSDQSSMSPPMNSNLSAYDDHQSLSPVLSSNLSQYGEHSLSPTLSNNLSPYSDHNASPINNVSPYGNQNIPPMNNDLRKNGNIMSSSSPPNMISSVSISDVQQQQCQVVPAIKPWNSPPSNFPIKIDYKVFPDIIPKHQKRVKGKSEQRIKNGVVSFILDFQDVITFHLIKHVHVAVKQTNEVDGTPQYIGPVNLKPKFESVDRFRYFVEVDLDSVYEVDGKKVYELQKTLTDELNKYHLIVDVLLEDGRTAKLKTKEFLVLGKETNNTNNNNNETVQKPQQIKKKKRKLSCSSDELIFNFGDEEPKTPIPSGYGSGREQDKEILRAQNIVADYVKTKSIEIDGVLISNKIESPNGDIAYHFQLDNSNEFFQEGEIVGLYTKEKECKPKLIKLTASNCNEVSLKGVITRSQYFEAMKPPPGVVSETVCMMGIIPVKVQGKVCANDALYASPKVPGVAVSSMYLDDDEIKFASVVGYAFQNLHQKENEIRLVQAGVSVLSSVSQTLLNKRLLDVEKNWERHIIQLEGKNSKFKRYFQIVGLVAVFVIVLIGILLWQLLLPGSALRYYKCKIGSTHGGTNYIIQKGQPIFDNFNINGIEFNYNELMKKINSGSYKYSTDLKYYLNIDRCAFGGERSTIDKMDGGIRVSGSIVFAVDRNCSKVYSFYEYENKWKPIENKNNKVKNLQCIS